VVKRFTETRFHAQYKLLSNVMHIMTQYKVVQRMTGPLWVDKHDVCLCWGQVLVS